MNRRKKIKSILTKKSKRANLKENPKKAKPKYISKAERAKMEAEESSVVESSEPSVDTSEDKT
ncbi:DUF2986 domain-containing protein [Marinomonas sp. GJ51-6]|uniref:DUF2986 domain-containing protein n=1 Tax=Marinomonas sp. GJ51-6 TaxID=2992802 RepID=UPI0029342D5B|nr:DUF2986 domain-containing protein [Marinomonas sp. GJ51-6]WOD07630.1 DUF2986 domain-containing protein [Marinomonas sp. GJ51-6]